MTPPPVLEVQALVKHYSVHGGLLGREVGTVHAVDGVSFTVGVAESCAWSNPPAARSSSKARTSRMPDVARCARGDAGCR